MFVLWLAVLLALAGADGLLDLQDIIDAHLESREREQEEEAAGRIRCRDITDIETLCEHKAQCMGVMPDLPDLCRSFKKEKHGVDEFVEIIDMRRSETHIIEMLAEMGSYADASPPVIIQGPKNLTVTPGSQYQLECKAEGAPTPKLTITRRSEASLNRVRTKGSDLNVQMSAAHVIHKNERVQSQDEGWYRCVAANSRGVAYADAFLTVYDLCGDITCTGGKICVPDNEAATAECVCPECVDLSFDPLCGSDCVTHFNYCQLEFKNCLDGTHYTRFLDGAFCPDFTPPQFIQTPPRFVEAVEGKAFTLTCKAAPAGDSPGPPPIISWYMADYDPEGPTDAENPTLYEPDYGRKLGDGETIKLRTKESMDIFCVAHQCKHGQSIPIDIVSDQVYVAVAPGEINVWNGGPSCQIFGDPHIITFDKNVYEFEGHCEYVLSMDCDKRKWSVYGSFETCSTHGRGACLSSVTLYFNGEISLELLRGKIVNRGGKRFNVAGLERIETESGEELYLFEKDDWLVIKFNVDGGNYYELRWDGLMSAQILLGANAPPTCGLCGNANGDPSDDFQMRYSKEVASTAAKFGDSWRIDRRNTCRLTAELPEWEWEKEFGDRRQEATRVCNKMFDSEQLVQCATGSGFGNSVSSKPYRDACITDYMRSDFLPDELAGLNMACVAVMNYAERCGNESNKNHLWREESGCAGETEELEQFKEFINQFDCDF